MSVDALLPPTASFESIDSMPRHATRFVGDTNLLSCYLELTKPRLVLLVLLTTAVGYYLGAREGVATLAFALTLFGTALVAGGACAWNQVLERDYDGRMRRTALRPLPSGRAHPVPSAILGSVLALMGLISLAVVDQGAALLSLLTFILYVAVYTPLKRFTTLNTAIGAVPGALPALIGWVAASGRLGAEGWALFLIVFLWQFPHFLAIAWIHRIDYERAGMRMLPGADPGGGLTAGQSLAFALLLVPTGLLPTFLGLAGTWYALASVLVAGHYLRAALRFRQSVSDRTARGLMHASFLYLPVILLLLVVDAIR